MLKGLNIPLAHVLEKLSHLNHIFFSRKLVTTRVQVFNLKLKKNVLGENVLVHFAN